MRHPLMWKTTTLQLATLVVSLLCMLAFFVLPYERLDLSPIFLWLFYTQDLPASVLALLIAMVACVVVDRRGRMEALLRHAGTQAAGPVMASFAITALGAVYVYHGQPLAMDEYAPMLQSRIFAAGRLAGHWPAAWLDLLVAVPHQQVFIKVAHGSGAIASAYWPGLALVMTPFTWLGLSWLCNPVITAATVWALSALLKALVEDSAARGFALCATVASPVILVNGMSYYGMPLQLLCSVMFTLGLVKGAPRHWLMAGAWAALGLTAVNPVPFAIYAVPWLVWLMAQGPRARRGLGWLMLGGLAPALLLGLGWRAFLLTHVQEQGPAALGANALALLAVFQLPTWSLLMARAMACVKLWLWAVPGLPLLALAVCGEGRRLPWIAVLATSTVLTVLLYLLVPFDQGHGWGYRYFHTAWLVLPLMAAAAMQRLGAVATERPRLYGYVFALCALTLLLSDAGRFWQVGTFIREHEAQIPARVGGGQRQAVFIDVRCGHYTSDLVQNQPFLPGPAADTELRLVSQGPQQDAAVAAALGSHPRIVAGTPCARRWLLD